VGVKSYKQDIEKDNIVKPYSFLHATQLERPQARDLMEKSCET